MKIRNVEPNNQKQAFELVLRNKRELSFPYARADPRPSPEDRIERVYVDPELANEGFTYRLASGNEGSVLADQVLEYHRDPQYMRDILLYEMTVEALDALDESAISRREICRRMRTSPTQLYRLLDPTNYRKSLDKMIALLQALDCTVSLAVEPHKQVRSPSGSRGDRE